MSCRVGVVSGRHEIVGEVAALVEGLGGEVVPVDQRLDPPARFGVSASMGSEGLDVLLVDALADLAGLHGTLTRHPGVERLLVCRESEMRRGGEQARRLGADHVVVLPEGRLWLQSRIESRAGSPLVGVVGAAGGAGATTVAIALATARRSLLVDLDPDGAGVHLPLGLDQAPGIRWEQLPAHARGPLDPESLLGAVPRAGQVPVLCGAVPEPGEGPVGSVLATARLQPTGAVLDLGRRDRHAVLGPRDWAVLVVPTTVAGVVAARRALARMPARVVLAVRESGWVPVPEVIDELDGRPAVRVPRLRRAAELAECGQLLSGASGRALLRVGGQLAELTS